MMKHETSIILYAFGVDYIDPHEPAPQSVHTESIVLDIGSVSALRRLGIPTEFWIRDKYSAQGYIVTQVHKGSQRTAIIDTAELWKLAAGTPAGEVV